MELVLEHEQLGAHVITLLFEHDAVLKHGTFEGDQTEVVVFFKFTEVLGDESNRTLIVENTAEGFIQNEHDATALHIVLRKEPVDRLFLLLKRGRSIAFGLLANILQSLVVNLLAFTVYQLLDFLQSTKSECVGTVSVQLDRLCVDAQGFVEVAVDEEVVPFQAQFELLEVARWDQVHSLPLLNQLNRNLFFAQRLLIS